MDILGGLFQPTTLPSRRPDPQSHKERARRRLVQERVAQPLGTAAGQSENRSHGTQLSPLPPSGLLLVPPVV